MIRPSGLSRMVPVCLRCMSDYTNYLTGDDAELTVSILAISTFSGSHPSPKLSFARILIFCVPAPHPSRRHLLSVDNIFIYTCKTSTFLNCFLLLLHCSYLIIFFYVKIFFKAALVANKTMILKRCGTNFNKKNSLSFFFLFSLLKY